MACNRSIACHWQDPREIWLFDNYQKAHTQIYYLVNFPCGLLTFHVVWKLSILSGNFWFCLETPTCESGWHFQILPYVYSSATLATSGATLHKLDACIESSIQPTQPKWVQIKIFIGKPTMRVLLTEHFLWAGNPRCKSVGWNICSQVFEPEQKFFHRVEEWEHGRNNDCGRSISECEVDKIAFCWLNAFRFFQSKLHLWGYLFIYVVGGGD